MKYQLDFSSAIYEAIERKKKLQSRLLIKTHISLLRIFSLSLLATVQSEPSPNHEFRIFKNIVIASKFQFS